MPSVEIFESVAFFVVQATAEDSDGKPIELSINRRFQDFDELDRRVWNILETQYVFLLAHSYCIISGQNIVYQVMLILPQRPNLSCPYQRQH